MQDTRWDQVELELLAVDHDRVAGVVAALVAHDGGRPLGEDVGDFALAFIAPLGAYDYFCSHFQRLPAALSEGRRLK
jgi:hypothetical protein